MGATCSNCCTKNEASTGGAYEQEDFKRLEPTPDNLSTPLVPSLEQRSSINITSAPVSDREIETNARRQWMSAIESNNVYLVESVSDEFQYLSIEETIFDDGERAVHRAIHKDNFELLVYLANTCGAKVDAPDALKGNTPLSLAVQMGRLDMVKFLTGQHPSYKLDDHSPLKTKDFTNVEGLSAVDYAALSKDVQIWYLVCPEKDLESYKPRERTLTVDQTPLQPRVDDTMSVNDDLDGKQEVEQDATEPENEPRARTTSLAPFGGWLQKRRAAGGATKPRYVVIAGEYIGWAEKEVSVSDIPRNKKVFKKYYHFNDIRGLEAMEDDWLRVRVAQTQSKVIVYEFKADDESKRDEWLNLLSTRVEYVTGKTLS